MRSPNALYLIATLALGLLVGCGGGASKTTKDPSAPSPTTVQQATTITSNEISAIHALMPTALVPPGLRTPGEGVDSAQMHLLPNPPTEADFLTMVGGLFHRASKVMPPPVAPCTPLYTSARDAEGVTTETWDYGVCSNGFSGKLILTYRYTSNSWRYDVTFDHLFQTYTLGSDLYHFAIHGTWLFSGTLDPSGHSYTFTYKTGPENVTITTTKNATSQVAVVLTDDTTCQWDVASAQPLTATFTTHGFFGEAGSFVGEDGNVVNGTFGFTIPQAAPLSWSYDATSTTNCKWPTSGVINITNGPEAMNFTFTSTCGQAIQNPGNKVVNF